jgi:hypothetical protein
MESKQMDEATAATHITCKVLPETNVEKFTNEGVARATGVQQRFPINGTQASLMCGRNI